jgi:thioredoxin reductase
MLRRNFLRNAAITLPVAIAAPHTIFAADSAGVKKVPVIIIGAGNAALYLASALAAANTDVLVLEPGNDTATNAWHNSMLQHTSPVGKQISHDELDTATFNQSKIITGRQLKKISCGSKGFTITDNHGQTYSAAKVIFNTPVEFSNTKAEVHIQASSEKKISISIKRNDSTSAKCVAVQATGICNEVITAFTAGSKPTIMCVL